MCSVFIIHKLNSKTRGYTEHRKGFSRHLPLWVNNFSLHLRNESTSPTLFRCTFRRPNDHQPSSQPLSPKELLAMQGTHGSEGTLVYRRAEPIMMMQQGSKSDGSNNSVWSSILYLCSFNYFWKSPAWCWESLLFRSSLEWSILHLHVVRSLVSMCWICTNIRLDEIWLETMTNTAIQIKKHQLGWSLSIWIYQLILFFETPFLR
jgi:hypothetical protein